jgi:hypothetical protein
MSLGVISMEPKQNSQININRSNGDHPLFNSNDYVDNDDEIYQVKSIFLHPNYYKVEKNIHVIKNFISQDESDWFVSVAESEKEENWWIDKRPWWNGKMLYIGDQNLGHTHIQNIFSKIKELFGSDENRWSFGGLMSIHRMQTGESMFLHADNPSGTGNLNNYVQFGMTMYHTNFDGGEIHYDNLGITYKPERGDILIHPGSTRYSHRTLPVKGENTRYVSTTFAYDPKVKKLRDSHMVFENMKDGTLDTAEPIYFYQKNNN